jgi:hypothetical protein
VHIVESGLDVLRIDNTCQQTCLVCIAVLLDTLNSSLTRILLSGTSASARSILSERNAFASTLAELLNVTEGGPRMNSVVSAGQDGCGQSNVDRCNCICLGV